MAKDSKPSDTRVPGWIWLITGVALGALITLLMRLSEMQPNPPTQHSNAKPTATQETSNPVIFKFYELLKDTEILVPEREVPAVQADDNTLFVLQVASFRSAEDAEQARAELMLLNLDAHIEKANVDSGQTWHRVIVGPYQNRSQMAKARDTLISNRYEAMLLKRKKAG